MTWELFISYDHLIELGIAIGIFLLFILFRKLFTKYVFRVIMRLIRKTRIKALSTIFQSFQKPMEWFFTLLGFYFALSYYSYVDHRIFNNLFSALIILLVTWGLVHLSSSSSELFRKLNDTTDIKIDELLIPILSRTLQVVIVAISITIILQKFGYNIEGLIAGLGLGGLAISLAAKDALANVLGGIIIISEKPFTIGDWILTPSVEGTVEDITFRSTKIRTFANALVSVPNNQLANEPITNWSKMQKRRITYNLSLSYDTPREKIERIIERIENLLKAHPEIHPETIFVRFDQYQQSSLDILLYFFTKTTVWSEYLEVRQEINFSILDIVREEGAEFAVSARKIYVENDPFGEKDERLSVRQET